MLVKLALLFLAVMALIVMVFGRPRRGDSRWSSRFRLFDRRPRDARPPERPGRRPPRDGD